MTREWDPDCCFAGVASCVGWSPASCKGRAVLKEVIEQLEKSWDRIPEGIVEKSTVYLPPIFSSTKYVKESRRVLIT